MRHFLVALVAGLLTTTTAAAHVSTVETFPLLETPAIQVQPLDTVALSATGLAPQVAQRALDALQCAQSPGKTPNKLIVVDMSLPSRQKRLWAFDLAKNEPRLILASRVAHGSGSDPDGDGIANRFSNVPNSNMTSLGLYRIAEAYEGKNGWSRRLDGLLARFNSKARERAVVMHPSNYVSPGHVGRSQGCPAVSHETMTALEKAGLSDAVLWIDGPDQALAATVQQCAVRHRELAKLAQIQERVVENIWIRANVVMAFALPKAGSTLS